MLRRIRENNFMIFLIRMVSLYIVWGVCRVLFGLYNADMVGSLNWSDIWPVIKGGFVFDTVSILYINIPFIILSLLPFRFREKDWYKKVINWIYIVPNAAGLIVNIGDVCYYPFKLSRIASDDLHLAGESNFGGLMVTFIFEYWWAVLFWLVCIVFLIYIIKIFRYSPHKYRMINPLAYYGGQTLIFCLAILWSVWAIRGFAAFRGTYPIAMSDVTMYVRPELSSLTLSNPFCLIRTKDLQYDAPKYFNQEKVNQLSPTVIQPIDSAKVVLNGQPNIVFLVLESFGSAHIKSINDTFTPDEESCTPNLDSIIHRSYTFTNAYHNGTRSIDALPSIWASIPSFKTQFLTMPQSVAEYYPLPAALRDQGYSTVFFHGAVRESMSFVSFGKSAGVNDFYSREDYEQEHGAGDYDGHWGIFDHKFLPFVGAKLNSQKQPFCATIFTVSSHHPYVIPDDVASRFPERKLPMRRAIAYADYALGEFFKEASQKEWFKNTLFIITADHSSASDNDKYLAAPYNYAVPVILYYPGGNLKGKDDRVMQHINIAPTLIRMLNYKKPFFSFGRDMFNDTDEPYAIYYFNGTFNFVVGEMIYAYNEKELLGAYNYQTDYFTKGLKTPLDSLDNIRVDRMKALIQQYYEHLNRREFK